MNEHTEQLLFEIEKLHKRNVLSRTVAPDYFEPGMMEYLECSEGIFDSETGNILIRFEVKGTRYEGRTEYIETMQCGDEINVVRDGKNTYNANNFTLVNKKRQNVGNMPAELCNAIAPLYDEGQLVIDGASASFVEPITRRSRHAKQAVLFVEIRGRLITSAELAETERIAEEKRKAEEAARIAEEKRKAEEAARIAEEKSRAEEVARIAEEKRRAEEAARIAEKIRRAEAERRKIEEERKTRIYNECREVFGNSSDILKLTEAKVAAEFLDGWKGADCLARDIQEKIERIQAENLRAERRRGKVCQHCGGKFKGLFSKSCSVCKKPKDY